MITFCLSFSHKINKVFLYLSRLALFVITTYRKDFLLALITMIIALKEVILKLMNTFNLIYMMIKGGN